MTVVVTGASGHIGAALVRALLDQGTVVRALVHSDRRAMDGLDLEVQKVDVTDRDAAFRAIAGAEVVYHAAARLTLGSGHDPIAERVNVQGTRNVLDACRAAGVRRLVHFSSAHALDAAKGELLDGGAGLVYERSKADAEREVIAAAKQDLDAVVVSPCAVLGPHDHKPSYIGRVLLMLAKGWLLATVSGGQSWVDVRDIASSAIAAADRGRRGARYVLGGRWLGMPEFATLASRSAGVRAPLFRIPGRVARAFAPLAERAYTLAKQEPLFTTASLDALEPCPRPVDAAATEDLGHHNRPLERTLDETFQWFREHGKLPRRRLD